MTKAFTIDYHDGDTLLEGYCVYDDRSISLRPAVLVAHDWSGKNDFACRKAEQLADLGYVGFALDLYGKGNIGKTKEEKTAFMQPFMEDRAKLQKRMLAAFNTVKQLDVVDKTRIGAIGFCFGGLCALDLARSGVENLKGVVSFHGFLQGSDDLPHHPIKASILALHGYDDPMITADQVMQFGDTMTKDNVDWQLVMYGHAMHAFTNPEANDSHFGTVYHPKADTRAWIAMREFFKTLF